MESNLKLSWEQLEEQILHYCDSRFGDRNPYVELIVAIFIRASMDRDYDFLNHENVIYASYCKALGIDAKQLAILLRR